MTPQKAADQTSAPVQSFGMQLDNLTPQLARKFGSAEKSGILVVSVEQGSLADEAGIQQGDVIKEVNRERVGNVAEFNAALKKRGKGEPVLFLMKREQQTFFVTLESE